MASELDAEVERIRVLMEPASEEPDMILRAHAMAELFDYIATTKHILKNAGFREMVKDRIEDLADSTPKILAIIGKPIQRLCAHMYTYDPTPVPGCPRDMSVPNLGYDIKGHGGYGVVFGPALPNIVNGIHTEYPNNVTKLYKHKSHRTGALHTSDMLPEIMGANNGLRMHRYAKTYKLRNLPKRFADELKSQAPWIDEDRNLPIARMKNLGVDIYKLRGAAIRELRSVPFSVILGQFQKLIHQTANLVEHKYVQMDIRDKNVMVMPSDGTLTIIDFDLLKTFNESFEEHQFGEYHTPPETLFIEEDTWQFEKILEETDESEEYLYEHMERLDDYVTYNMRQYKGANNYRGISTKEAFRAAVLAANKENIRQLRSVTETELYSDEDIYVKYIATRIDNYGLALTLLEFISKVYPGGVELRAGDREYTAGEIAAHEHAMTDIVRLLLRMCAFVIQERPTVAEAVAEIDRIVAQYGVEAGAAGGGLRRNRTRRQRRKRA